MERAPIGALSMSLAYTHWPAFTPPRWPGIRPALTRHIAPAPCSSPAPSSPCPDPAVFAAHLAPLQGRMPGRWGRCRPHPPQTRTCGFPASGSSRERFAHGSVAVDDLDGRQRVASQHVVEAGPQNRPLTISPGQPLSPDPSDLIGEPSQPPRVAADAVVGEVAPHHRGQVAVLLAKGPVPVFPTPVAHRGNRPGKTALRRDLPNHGPAVPRPSPHVGQAEEVEAGPIRCRMAGAPLSFAGGSR